MRYGDAGYGQFVSTGNHLTVCDEKIDGHGIRAEFYVQESRSKLGAVPVGDGAGCALGTISAPPGFHLRYRVCITMNGASVSCTGFVQDVTGY